ncbi:hypothetical protein BROUX41_004681 [Berkeleyomyces rouxiae]|uniref:uncharacterized protein n=1 Tax=Berkeleyomyces rouxiae TaxID=2035830 RepID=UPI003B7A7799
MSSATIWCSICRANRNAEDFSRFQNGAPRKTYKRHEKKRKATGNLDSWDGFIKELKEWNPEELDLKKQFAIESLPVTFETQSPDTASTSESIKKLVDIFLAECGFRYQHSGVDDRITPPLYTYIYCQGMDQPESSTAANTPGAKKRKRFPCQGWLKLRPLATQRLNIELSLFYLRPYRPKRGNHESCYDSDDCSCSSVSNDEDSLDDDDDFDDDDDEWASISSGDFDDVSSKLKATVDYMKEAIKIAEGQAEMHNTKFMKVFIKTHAQERVLVKEIRMIGRLGKMRAG